MMTILSWTRSLRRLLALAVFAASIVADPVNTPAQSAAPFDPSTFCGEGFIPGQSTDCVSGNLTGPIPPEIGNLTNLTNLDLSGGNLTGPIPPEIGNLTNLRFLDLSYNRLTGPIPPEIGLTNLAYLDLSRNRLTGPIPPEIGNLNLLGVWGGPLDLSYNQLTGPIPPEIGNLTSLRWLELSYNQLTGPIPPEIGNLNILSLGLNNNRLTGPIPPEIGNLTGLGGVNSPYLDLSYNRLTGPIPPEILEITNLEGVNLRGLNLKHNRLTGPIPPEIMSAFGSFSPAGIAGSVDRSALRRLNLGFNMLTGTIPDLPPLDDNWGDYGELNLRCNELTGPIPEKLRKVYGSLSRESDNPRLRGNMLTGPAYYLHLRPTCFFNDIGGSVHEANINLIAARDITTGCETEMFCPSRTVNRAQMATFLRRAAYALYGYDYDGLHEYSDIVFSDVADGAWYRDGAQWAVYNGVIRAPGGVFDPGGAVTRADMAEMLVAAFAHLSAPDRAEGVFTDTAGLTDAAVRAAEGIAAAGVTAGCADAPRRYCPAETVTRAQMASFLARAVSGP